MRQDMTSNGQDRVLDEVQDTGQYGPERDQDATRQEFNIRVTVHEAANALGVSVDAIRKRIQRGTILYERQEDGRVYVLLDKSSTMQDKSSTSSSTSPGEDEEERPVRYGTDELVESLQDQIGFLRRELERKDAILLRMAERIPELEASTAPSEQRDAPEAVSKDTSEDGVLPPEPQNSVKNRSWLYHFFFGPG